MSKKHPLIFLASKSSRRKQILRQMNVPFRVVPSDYEERTSSSSAPRALVIRHAVGKAKRAHVPHGARYVIGADTVVWCGGKLLGKPKSAKQACRTLLELSGRSHIVYTGVAIWDRERDTLSKGIEKTKVQIKRLSKKQVEDYFRRVRPFDKAGAYAIQSGPPIVEKIVGSYTNVMGLPKELLGRMIREMGRYA